MLDDIEIGCATTNSKYKDRLDCALVKIPATSSLSGVFTTNHFKSAPVKNCIKKLSNATTGEKLLMVNAGNANAGTGRAGEKDIESILESVSLETGIAKKNILPFSTGVIGERLDKKSLQATFIKCANLFKKNNFKNFATSIMTTDTKLKIAKRTIKVGSKKYSIVGVAKGVGMIEPNMATTLSFVFTDLKINSALLKKIHKNTCNDTFNTISIDGEQSPSDSSILVATGSNAIKPDKFLKTFESSLTDVFSELSEKLLLDGEGATKLIEIKVSGLRSKAACKEVAKKIANSPLLKTAAYGEDPNWGRILSAAGNTNNKFHEKDVTIKIGNTKVFHKGEIHKSYKESLGKKEFKKKKISIAINLGLSKHNSKVKTSDLSHEYVSINSDYRS